MSKASPVLVALLVLALVAPASVGGVALLDATTAAKSPDLGASENTTRVLQLEEVAASGFGSPRVVVLDAATVQTADIDTAYSIQAVGRRLADAPNASARRQVLQNYTEAAEQDVRDLQNEERAARQAYMQDRITRHEYAQRLAVIHARAELLQRFLGSTAYPQPTMWSYSSSFPGIRDRVNYLREDLEYLTGPVRAEMADVVTGDRDSLRVYVAVDETGFTLAHIRPDGVYVRSAYRSDNVDDDPTSVLGISEVETLVGTLYPWAMDANSTGELSNLGPTRDHGTSEVTLSHRHGRLTAMVDETTELVYYEVQYKRLDGLPTETRYNSTRNDTRVLVSSPYPGGPLRVQLLDVSGDDTAAYIGVPVTVNGTTRKTGVDGTAWFVSPRGTYNVTTTANETEFEFDVTAT